MKPAGEEISSDLIARKVVSPNDYLVNGQQLSMG
jgi:hypothetical protein